MKISIFLVLALILNNCGITRNNKSTIYNGNLIGEWVHVYEEDFKNVKVFRLSTYKLKPSRGREKLIFKNNGKLEYYTISPNDLPRLYAGRWKIENSVLILEYENNRKKFEIIESTSSILKLK